MRSVENVCQEVDMLTRRYARRRFIFDDANFIQNKRRTMSLCKGLLRVPGGMSWKCSTRVDCADAGLFLLMRQAGCETVYFGIESADPKVLGHLGKRYGRNVIIDAVKCARSAGLKVGIFLTVGNPGETVETVKGVKRLLLELSPFSELNINPLVVLPGTKMYHDLVRDGRITEDDYYEKDELIFFDGRRKAYQEELGPLVKFFEIPRSGPVVF